MATIEQGPAADVQDAEASSTLNGLLARAYTLNWEKIFYLSLFALAVITRFVNLGDRVMSHDESLHVTYSFNLWKKGEYTHTPLMHGPVLFHATALMFFLFGDNDFTGRLYPAILGVIMVLMPKLLFERWLGKRGAMVASVLLLISPMVLYHNRYIREDTPSIFFTLIMVYAIFAYVDGIRPKQVRWLIVLSAAMLLSLASKEVAFMYILIFALFLVLFWLFQVAQGIRSGLTRPLAGYVIGGVIGVGLIGAASLLIGNFISDRLFAAGGAQISGWLIAAPVAVLLALGALVLVPPARFFLGSVALEGNSLFKLLTAGAIIGTVAALAMTCFLTIAPLDPNTSLIGLLQSRLLVWIALMALVLLAVILLTALVRFMSSPRLPLRDISILVLVAVGVCAALVFLEERTRVIKEATAATGTHDEWLLLTWIVGAALVALILVLRFATSFFQEMKRYPVFDVLMVIGTLILPWLSAVPIFLAGYPMDDQMPSASTINAGIAGTIPFIIVSIVAGLVWNPGVWLTCAATFYSIFAFFFTTIFTNILGMFSGMVGSLGYWLAQQGVRRGSQPQYYYLLVELPVYEYLPVIGAIVAGIAGMLGMWRFRADRMAERAALAEVVAEAGPPLDTSDLAEAAVESQSPQALFDAVEVPTEAPGDVPAGDFADETVAAQATEINEAADYVEGEEKPKRGGADDFTELDEEACRRVMPEAEWLDRLPFLSFVGVWAVLLLMLFTMAGEKMPWLTTHLTVPLIFATGWYLGTVLDKVDWQAFWNRGWALILLSPILVIALANVIGPFVFGKPPLSGLSYEDLLKTFTWMGALVLAGLIVAAVVYVSRRIGAVQTVRIAGLGVFVLLGVLTFRTAWMAAYINYDYATEFLVYAHGAPANKTAMSVIEDISRRTTDGLNIRVAYDNLVSWPGSWYFRNYPGGSFKGDMSGFTDADTYLAILVGNDNNAKIESQLADKFYKVKYIRLWWPMQDYFYLNPERIDHLFEPFEYTGNDGTVHKVAAGDLARGVWDIWWNRDYTAYGNATGGDFDVSRWPVADWMYFYVRKDVAAQIWNFGTGAAKVAGLPEDAFKNLRCDTCTANLVFAGAGDQPGQLNHPRGVTFGPDGNLYVADSQNARISIYDPDGKFLRQFGTVSTTDPNNPVPPPGGSLREPWGVAVGQDGTIYVADTWNHRIQVFDNNGTFLRMWGEFEQLPAGQEGKVNGFWGPRDIAVDSQNNVYVADTGNKRIRVYSAQGNLLRTIGQGGAAMGQLNEPVGLAINSRTGELFVADTWNRRIDVFDLSGTYRRSWNVLAWSTTTETGSRPYMALDKTGTRLFVTDPDAGRVLVFDTNGTAMLTFGTLGTDAASFSAGQFGTLGGIVIDKADRLFLADAQSSRLLRFSVESLPGLIPPPVAGSGGQPVIPPEQIGTPAATSEVF